MKTKYTFLAAAFALLSVSACSDDSVEPNPAPKPAPEPAKETLDLGNITTNTTLEDIFTDPATPDYRVTADVKISAVLTIKPGVVIEVAQGKGIEVSEKGLLPAVGQQDKKIIFRGKSQTTGYWKGITVYAGSQASVMEHVEIAHTGSSVLFDNKKAAIGLFGSGSNPAKLSIKNSQLHHNAGYGIYVAGDAQLTGFAANSFTHHAESGLYISADEVQNLDAASVFSDNAKGDIEVFSGTIDGPAQVVWPAYTYRYTSGTLFVKTGWEISAGAVIEMGDGLYIEVSNEPDAYIHAAGTATKKVTFTSIKKEPGAWKGLGIFSANDSNLLEHTVVENGGSSVIYGVKANIYVPFSNRLTIRNSKVANSAGYGIYYRSTATLNSDFEQVNAFEANASGTVYKD